MLTSYTNIKDKKPNCILNKKCLFFLRIIDLIYIHINKHIIENIGNIRRQGTCMNKQIPTICVIILILLYLPANGQSLRDIQEMKDRYNEVLKQSEISKPVPENIPTELPAPEILKAPVNRQQESRYYGYDFFTGRENVTFFDNLPAPAHYILGPGDELIISLWGETQLRSTHVINRSGTIYVDKVGLLNLTGKSLESGEQYLKKQFERVYSTLKGKNPASFMDLSLGSLKAINVHFVGEVVNPGIHAVHPFSNVLTGLMQVGGIDTTGSLRSIQRKRDSNTSELDLYSFLMNGDLSEDIKLKDGDIVHIPIRRTHITISGSVHRPMIYEGKQGETIADLISYSGGGTRFAGNQIELKRTIPVDIRVSDDSANEMFYIEYTTSHNVTIQDGDEIRLMPLKHVEKSIEIIGQVKNPGKYYFSDSLSLIEALRLAGGIEDHHYLKTMYEKGKIIRRTEHSDYTITVPFNIENITRRNALPVYLQNLDQIIIHRNPLYDEPETITIKGEVLLPGTYALDKDNISLENLIIMSGGLTSRGFRDGININRNSKIVIWEDHRVTLFPGDTVLVPRKPGTILVTGEVMIGGYIEYVRGFSMKHYIEMAGGYTEDANTDEIMVIYPNGEVKEPGWFFDPAIKEGCVINVKQQEKVAPLDKTELLKEIASITASLATIFFVIQSSGG